MKTSLIVSGSEVEIPIEIPLENLTYWDETNSKWILEKGTYKIHIGNSSRNIKLSSEIIFK